MGITMQWLGLVKPYYHARFQLTDLQGPSVKVVG